MPGMARDGRTGSKDNGAGSFTRCRGQGAVGSSSARGDAAAPPDPQPQTQSPSGIGRVRRPVARDAASRLVRRERRRRDRELEQRPRRRLLRRLHTSAERLGRIQHPPPDRRRHRVSRRGDPDPDQPATRAGTAAAVHHAHDAYRRDGLSHAPTRMRARARHPRSRRRRRSPAVGDRPRPERGGRCY